jgi:hypothetical protein
MRTDDQLIALDEKGETSDFTADEKKKLKILKAKLKARKTKEDQKQKQEQKDKEAVEKWELPSGKKHFTITSWQSACLWEYKVFKKIKLKQREPTLTAQFVKNHFKVFVFNVHLQLMFQRIQMKNALFRQENVIISITNIALQIG